MHADERLLSGPEGTQAKVGPGYFFNQICFFHPIDQEDVFKPVFTHQEVDLWQIWSFAN